MYLAYAVVTVSTIAANLVASVVDYLRMPWILDNMTAYGIPRSWVIPLGLAKTAGAAGLAVGLVVPWVGVAAAAGLVAFFVGAVATIVRARRGGHLRFPTPFLALAVASLVLRLATW